MSKYLEDRFDSLWKREYQYFSEVVDRPELEETFRAFAKKVFEDSMNEYGTMESFKEIGYGEGIDEIKQAIPQKLQKCVDRAMVSSQFLRKLASELQAEL